MRKLQKRLGFYEVIKLWSPHVEKHTDSSSDGAVNKCLLMNKIREEEREGERESFHVASERYS